MWKSPPSGNGANDLPKVVLQKPAAETLESTLSPALAD